MTSLTESRDPDNVGLLIYQYQFSAEKVVYFWLQASSS